jgi:hypothetical protein
MVKEASVELHPEPRENLPLWALRFALQNQESTEIRERHFLNFGGQ